jgi:hypothetical protein
VSALSKHRCQQIFQAEEASAEKSSDSKKERLSKFCSSFKRMQQTWAVHDIAQQFISVKQENFSRPGANPTTSESTTTTPAL